MQSRNLYLGIDIGTSGVRSAVIDDSGLVLGAASVPMEAPIHIDDRPCQDANVWWEAAAECLLLQAQDLREFGRGMSDIAAVSVDGTSGTLLLTDDRLQPLTHGLMYNSANFDAEAEVIANVAPEDSIVQGAGSGLGRLLFLQNQPGSDAAAHALHQADWIAARLMNHGGQSDETNVLKMGYDVVNRRWPDWMEACGVRLNLLPDVSPVGDEFGVVCQQAMADFGFAANTRVIAGTTDSNAAFLASGASSIGDGVTSLGTTLAIKLLSNAPVVDPSRGVYSHRIGDKWLPGGASNTGGRVLLEHFTTAQMQAMERDLVPDVPTGLDYYPLSRAGERFPVADPDLEPRLTPRPDSDVTFYQGMLEGISSIEQSGYAALRQLGAAPLKRVFTAGGGAKNAAWAKIRAARLRVPIVTAESSDASVGTAGIAAGRVGDVDASS